MKQPAVTFDSDLILSRHTGNSIDPLQAADAQAVYFGDPSVNGTFRIMPDATNDGETGLFIQQLQSDLGIWRNVGRIGEDPHPQTEPFLTEIREGKVGDDVSRCTQMYGGPYSETFYWIHGYMYEGAFPGFSGPPAVALELYFISLTMITAACTWDRDGKMTSPAFDTRFRHDFAKYPLDEDERLSLVRRAISRAAFRVLRYISPDRIHGLPNPVGSDGVVRTIRGWNCMLRDLYDISAVAETGSGELDPTSPTNLSYKNTDPDVQDRHFLDADKIGNHAFELFIQNRDMDGSNSLPKRKADLTLREYLNGGRYAPTHPETRAPNYKGYQLSYDDPDLTSRGLGGFPYHSVGENSPDANHNAPLQTSSYLVAADDGSQQQSFRSVEEYKRWSPLLVPQFNTVQGTPPFGQVHFKISQIEVLDKITFHGTELKDVIRVQTETAHNFRDGDTAGSFVNVIVMQNVGSALSGRWFRAVVDDRPVTGTTDSGASCRPQLKAGQSNAFFLFKFGLEHYLYPKPIVGSGLKPEVTDASVAIPYTCQRFLGQEWGAVKPFALKKLDLPEMPGTFVASEFRPEIDLMGTREGLPVLRLQDQAITDIQVAGRTVLVSTGEAITPGRFCVGDIVVFRNLTDPAGHPVPLQRKAFAVRSIQLNGFEIDFDDVFLRNPKKGTILYFDRSKSGARWISEFTEVATLQVQLNDRRKMIAEFYANGPLSELNPSQFMRHVLELTMTKKRPSPTLDSDLKLCFGIAAALSDAAIAIWECKRYYDSARPITAIRYLRQTQGMQGWAGPGTAVGSNIQGEDWLPYQSISFVTPAFPEFVSGHSAFSAAAVEFINCLYGNDDFGSVYKKQRGSSNLERDAPADDVYIYNHTMSKIATTAGWSRVWGGIHAFSGNRSGALLGKRVGRKVYELWKLYMNGASDDELQNFIVTYKTPITPADL